MIIVDGHQDIAWNMLTFGRDYTRSVAETRRRERGTATPALNGDALLGWPDYQRGCVALIFASLFATPMRFKCGEWDTLCYRDQSQAYGLYRAQVDLYRRLVDDHPDKFRLVVESNDLQEILNEWQLEAHLEPEGDTESTNKLGEKSNGPGETPAGEDPVEDGHPVGLILLMEGAEAVRAPSELDEWWEMGVRLIGPAWGGTRFCGGTYEPGPMTREGFTLLDAMAELGFILDLSHMDEQAALQALDHYHGTILATHTSAAALLREPGNRFLSDRLIHGILERDGVIGVVPANGFLDLDWRHRGGRAAVGLDHVVAQIDHICQLAGDARHVALGSDFDGGFGLQSVPHEIDTIADLQKLAPRLRARGYSGEDVGAVLAGNWLRAVQQTMESV